MSAVERTLKYATIVESLDAALAFVIMKLDEVGPDPSVTITPQWAYGDGENGETRRFEVSVSGMTADVRQPLDLRLADGLDSPA